MMTMTMTVLLVTVSVHSCGLPRVKASSFLETRFLSWICSLWVLFVYSFITTNVGYLAVLLLGLSSSCLA